MDVIKTLNMECAVLADEQTLGRGKPGSVWQSIKGNFMCSFKILNKYGLNQCQLSVFFGLVIGEVVQSYIEKVQYKYPNDVYVQDKKIAGVLIEFDGDFIVVGMGVNLLNSPAFATNLLEYGVKVSSREFLQKILVSYQKISYLLICYGWTYLEKKWEKKLLNTISGRS